jgi:hypothetical protein
MNVRYSAESSHRICNFFNASKDCKRPIADPRVFYSGTLHCPRFQNRSTWPKENVKGQPVCRSTTIPIPKVSMFSAISQAHDKVGTGTVDGDTPIVAIASLLVPVSVVNV